jgi:hypothetical protein
MPEQTKYLRNYLSNLEIASSFDDEGLELHICHAAMNIGVMWFRSTSGARLLTEEWVRLIEADDDLWDQNAFNDLVRLGGSCSAKPPSDGSGLFRGFEGKVVVGTLPASQFANGHAFHAQRMHSAKKKDPFAVHNTFQYGGTPGKRHRMREANVWRGEDVDSRFLLRSDGSDGTDDRVGFLSYDPRLPADVDLSVFSERSWPDAKDDTFPTIASKHDPIVDAHAKLVEFQLAQLRTAVAVASSLGRVVIAPPISVRPRPRVVPALRAFPGIAIRVAVYLSPGPRLGGRAVAEDGPFARALVFKPPGASRYDTKIGRDRGRVTRRNRGVSQVSQTTRACVCRARARGRMPTIIRRSAAGSGSRPTR